MQTLDSKVVVETELAIIMAECNIKGKEIMPNKNEEKNKNEELKRLFEGESCCLAYNSDDDWFDDEDEEFEFDGSNRWFEEAWEEGLKEAEEMRRIPERKNDDDEEDEKIEEKTIVINIIF